MFKEYASHFSKDVTIPGKRLKKLGTQKISTVEATPVVWQGRLLRFEWVRSNKWAAGKNDHRELGYYHFVDMETEQEVGAPFAYGNAFGCCYEENGVMYAHGVGNNGDPCNFIDVYYSKDLVNWETKKALTIPEELSIFNTSVCKDEDGYTMAIEIDGPKEIVGEKYTIIFAKSKNLLDWELLPIDKYIYYKESYSACPSIRYFDGQYYMVYLESLPFLRWTPYIVRTPDLLNYEVAVINPFMMFDDDDKKIIHPERFTDEEIKYIKESVDCNNSDVDFCEFEGKTCILYSWGNQRGKEFLGVAEYDGGLEEFLKSYFR